MKLKIYWISLTVLLFASLKTAKCGGDDDDAVLEMPPPDDDKMTTPEEESPVKDRPLPTDEPPMGVQAELLANEQSVREVEFEKKPSPIIIGPPLPPPPPRPLPYYGLCSNLPRGLLRLTSGVDITTLDLTPLDFSKPDGFKKPVIDLTCFLGLTWTCPFTGNTFQMPDQLASIYAVPGGWLNSATKLYTSSLTLKQELSYDCGIQYRFGMFSKSYSYQFLKNEILNQSKTITDVSAIFSTVRVNFVPPQYLYMNYFAQSMIWRLPYSFEWKKYQEFIDTFGTHYWSSGKLGGYVRRYFETNENYYLQSNEEDIKQDARQAFGYYVWMRQKSQDIQYKAASEAFMSNSFSSELFYGGNLDFDSANTDVNEWSDTIPNNPWLFGGELLPISDLIRDKEKKYYMEMAVQAHLDRACMHDLRTDLETYLVRNRGGVVDQALRLKEILGRLLEPKVPETRSVAKLKTEADYHLVVPEWWRYVCLCFDWRENGNPLACGAAPGGSSIPRRLCAETDEYTQLYTDNTQSAYGGCKMSWGISSTNQAPDWFRRQVFLCFKFTPTIDGKQCNNGKGKNREICAPVNDFTSPYRDDSDKRDGGCKMSWTVKVKNPEEVPEWFLNTQLCFSYKPLGDTLECGAGGVPQTEKFCSRPNTWTDWYLDDTDSRPGSCQMSWALVTHANPKRA